MERLKCSLEAAGRLMVELVQIDWEPLSRWELDQRLDQAVEELMEADLVARVQARCGPVLLQVSRPHETGPAATTHVSDPRASAVHRESTGDIEGNPAVQYVAALLQSSHSGRRQARMAGRARLALSHTVFLSLTLLSKRLSYRTVSSTFRLEKGNIHRIFFSFCERVNALEEQMIQWPTGPEALEHLLPFSSWLGWDERLEEKGLPRVLGVLGHTRIPIRLPISKQDSESDVPDVKRLKKEPHPDSWLNLELVCSSEGRFIHCRITRGSEKDRGRGLSEKLRLHPELMPPRTCLLAGAGYPLTAHILTPFLPGRSPQENLYNRSVEAHLARFDQAVADLKERFQKLRYLDMGNFERARAAVLTSCILHNALLDMGSVSKGQAEKEEEEEEEGGGEEGGVKLRDAVVSLLYSSLEAGTN
ncbi:uncharacterized protein LOC113580895 [Electrophorus electricus]|uniref:DDE Tnp4 domain-containing protein n=1 Tax=Electrophorus electricus TaxID=8005 RepID=A0A4W4FV22_ELEEL|nr:uncharacterized protein LOC113580895 [Electrophorus electricus]